MIIESDIADFLSHHGVKGQRWGVRNNRVQGDANKNNVRKKRIVKGVAIGGAIAATALVSSVLARKGMVPVSQLRTKELQLAKIQQAINKAQHSWNNPVRQNQRDNLKAFVKKLDMSG